MLGVEILINNAKSFQMIELFQSTKQRFVFGQDQMKIHYMCVHDK